MLLLGHNTAALAHLGALLVIENNRLVLRSSVKLKSMFHTSTLTAALLMEEENLAIWALTLECVDWAGLAEGELSVRGLG